MTERASPEQSGGRLEQSIGQEVKLARTASGMTLKSLTARSGVSVAMISKIERGQVSASVSTLNAIARAAGVPVANLFASTVEKSDVAFVPGGQGVSYQRAGSTYNHSYRMIGRVEVERVVFESFLITLEEPVSGEPLFQHGGAEFIHVLGGSMTYRVGGTDYDMEPGDSITFGTLAPHGPVRLRSSPVEILTVIAKPVSHPETASANLLWR